MVHYSSYPVSHIFFLFFFLNFWVNASSWFFRVYKFSCKPHYHLYIYLNISVLVLYWALTTLNVHFLNVWNVGNQPIFFTINIILSKFSAHIKSKINNIQCLYILIEHHLLGLTVLHYHYSCMLKLRLTCLPDRQIQLIRHGDTQQSGHKVYLGVTL